MTCGFLRLVTIQLGTKLQKCIRMGKTIFREVYRRKYVRKSRFTARLACHRKTKFPTVYPTIYLPKLKVWIQLSPNSNALANATRRLIGSRHKFATVYPAIYCRNPTSLRNVAFHWLSSEYMQLASGFMQLASLDVYAQQSTFSLSFWRENVNSALEWG